MNYFALHWFHHYFATLYVMLPPFIELVSLGSEAIYFQFLLVTAVLMAVNG